MSGSGSGKKFWLGVDLGGTKILSVVVNEDWEVLAVEKKKMETDRNEKYFLKDLFDHTAKTLKTAGVSAGRLAGVGVGCAGMIRYPEGVIRLSPNIPFMKQFPLKDKIRRHFKRPAWIENDVNAGLYGEFKLGAAKGAKDVVGIFPGTGVGGALILDGRLYRGAFGAAGEVGHMFLSLEGLLYGGYLRGTLEAMIGRPVIAAEAVVLGLKGRAKTLLKEAGSDIRGIKSKALRRSIEGGDRAIEELVRYKGRVLGVGMANLANILNPELFVLGGGLVEALGEWIVPEARETLERYAMPTNVSGVKVRKAKLGDLAVAVGAARVCRDEYQDARKKR